MKHMLHHVAICVTDYDWHVEFFKEVFEMNPYREIGVKPHRKIWFDEGIQLDELPDGSEVEMQASFPSHLGLQTEHLETILERAFAHNCVPYSDKHHWFVMPNGLKIEMKENPIVTLNCERQK